jgi:hypothetical protein
MRASYRVHHPPQPRVEAIMIEETRRMIVARGAVQDLRALDR